MTVTPCMVCRFLEPQYRRPLILQELLGFHADIICLQEVDEKAFAEYFLPQLQQAGTVSSTWTRCILCLHMSLLMHFGLYEGNSVQGVEPNLYTYHSYPAGTRDQDY